MYAIESKELRLRQVDVIFDIHSVNSKLNNVIFGNIHEITLML